MKNNSRRIAMMLQSQKKSLLPRKISKMIVKLGTSPIHRPGFSHDKRVFSLYHTNDGWANHGIFHRSFQTPCEYSCFVYPGSHYIKRCSQHPRFRLIAASPSIGTPLEQCVFPYLHDIISMTLCIIIHIHYTHIYIYITCAKIDV